MPFPDNTQAVSKEKLATILPALKEKRNKSLITLVFTLVAIVFFSLFAIQPTLTTIAQLKKQLEDETFVDQKMQQKISALSSLQRAYTQINLDMPTILTSIPSTPEIPSFLAKLQTIASQTGANLVRVQTFPVDIIETSPTGTSSYNSFAFSLDINGPKGSITLFLNKLLSMDRLVTIDGFSLAQASQVSDVQRLTVKGKLYFQKTVQ